MKQRKTHKALSMRLFALTHAGNLYTANFMQTIKAVFGVRKAKERHTYRKQNQSTN